MTIEPVPSRAPEVETRGLIAERFEVESILGRSGMGSVYRVRDRQSGRTLALKRLSADRARNATLRGQFEREYTALARLAHPRIIEVYDYGVHGDSAYYTMELLDGADMSALSPLPYERACRYLREIATSLALLHARRLVHRDVTPRNVRLTHDDHCKLLDFGALAAVGESGALIGTPPCVPPEALDDQPLDRRVDLYALGCVAYFMLTGRHAYPASHTQQLPSYWAQPRPPPSALKPECTRDGEALPAIPQALDELVCALLQLDRLERPASAGAVIDRLDVILGRDAREEFELAESYLLSAPTVGHDQPLGETRKSLDLLARGRGAAVLFEGPSGSGKSRVLSDLAIEARLRGAVVVRADAEVYERPYATAHALMNDLLELVPHAALEAAAPHAAVLGHIVPELATSLRQALAPQLDDPLLWRSRVQTALRAFLLDLSRRVPLVVLVDNLQRCDHASAALLAALAREARQNPLVIACALRTETEAIAPAACNAMRPIARVHELYPLSNEEMQTWFEALFGDAANVPRLAQFLRARSEGNPGAVMELLRMLVRHGEIRYRDGNWALPVELTGLSLPEHAEEAQQRRIAGLSDTARGLARALCMYRGAVGLELCRNLSGDMDDAVLRAALDELLARGVLSLRRQGYGFTHDALRDALQRGLEGEQRAELQRRIASAILKRKNPHLSERMEAGLHLLEAGDDRGMQLLSRSAVEVCLGGEGVEACAPTLVTAFETAQARGRSAYEIGPILAALGLAAYMVDRRFDRFTEPLIACFERLLALDLARKLRPYLGKHLSTWLALAVGFTRHALTPSRERMCSFPKLVQTFMVSCTALCGKAAICLDKPAIDRVAAAIEPLASAGVRRSATFTYDYCLGLGMLTGDRLARTHQHWLGLERRILVPRAMSDISPEAKRLLAGGVNYVIGVFEAVAGDPRVLERIRELEDSQLDIHALIAAQLRLQYHGFRGETDAVARATAQLEMRAVQTGYAWQVEAWSAISINMYGGMWKDVLITKRATDETERLALEVRSLERYTKSSKAIYLFERGQPRDAVKLLDEVRASEQPFQRIGWGSVSGQLAEALNQLGDHQRAKALCEEIARDADAGDAVYGGLRLILEVAHINAHAGLGEFEQAEQRLAQALALHAKFDNPLTLGTLHETAALIAFSRKDRKAYTHHLKELERLFCPLGNPALIARFRRLTLLGGKEGGMDAKIASMRELKAFDTTLAAVADRADAARHIFTWLMQKCEGYNGYLLAREPNGLELLASTTGEEAPAEAEAIVQRSLETLGKEDVTTHYGANAHADANMDAETAVEDPSQPPIHVHLLSFVDADRFFGEGALVLRGHSDRPPRIRYDLLQVAARHLRRLRDAAPPDPSDTGSA